MRLLLSLFFVFLLTVCQSQNVPDITRYKFKIELSDTSNKIKGEADITGLFKEPSNELTLDLKNTEGSKGMTIQTVSGSGISAFRHTHNKLHIRFQKQRQVNDSFRVKVIYSGVPADGLIISKNKYGERTFFSDNWPNRAHNWIPCNDRPDDKASFEFIVSAPSHYSVISNGLKIEEKETGNGTKLTHWKEDMPLSTKIMVIGVAGFATKLYEDSPNDIPVTAWMYPKDSTQGFYDYAVAPSILKFFAENIGPFPYKKLANVQSKTIFGGMENASCIFYNEDYATGKRQHEDVIAHEIAHQWFGDMVSEKSFAHLWISEGFADYFEHYYFEKKYGEKVAREKWEDSRRKVIEFVRQSSKPVVDSTEDLMSLLNANSYNKGSWFLRMLQSEVGDKTFLKIVQTFYNQYKGGNAETKDFEAVAENISGKELSWFFQQWLYQPGIPQLHIRSKIQNSQLYLYIKQIGKPYRFKLGINVIEKDREIIRKDFEIAKKEEMFSVPVNTPSATFAIDPDSKLLYELKH